MSRYRWSLLALGLLLAVGILACSFEVEGLGGPGKPTVEILSPPSGSQVPVGEEMGVEFRAEDEVGVVRVELEADGQSVDSQNSPQPEGQDFMGGVLHWVPTTPGTHTLLVRAYNRDGAVSDTVGVSIIAIEGAGPGLVGTPVPPGPSPAVMPSTPLPGTPADTVVPSTPLPVTPADTPVPPTPTHTRVPPTPTQPSISCPGLTILHPHTGPLGGDKPFGIQFERKGELPSGYGYLVEYSWDKTTWNRLQPIPAVVREDFPYWMAEAWGPGGEGWCDWRLCLINTANLAGPGVCCTPPWRILHS